MITPDDWSWVWRSVSEGYNYNIFSASIASGWFAIGQTTTNCSLSITSVDTASISLTSSVSSIYFITM